LVKIDCLEAISAFKHCICGKSGFEFCHQSWYNAGNNFAVWLFYS